jgi:hypothetical protein
MKIFLGLLEKVTLGRPWQFSKTKRDEPKSVGFIFTNIPRIDLKKPPVKKYPRTFRNPSQFSVWLYSI